MSERPAESNAFVLIGAIGAAALSYAKFHSIGWAIWSAVCGWLYIIYYFFAHYL
jgi:hypothetical protein